MSRRSVPKISHGTESSKMGAPGWTAIATRCLACSSRTVASLPLVGPAWKPQCDSYEHRALPAYASWSLGSRFSGLLVEDVVSMCGLRERAVLKPGRQSGGTVSLSWSPAAGRTGTPLAPIGSLDVGYPASPDDKGRHRRRHAVADIVVIGAGVVGLGTSLFSRRRPSRDGPRTGRRHALSPCRRLNRLQRRVIASSGFLTSSWLAIVPSSSGTAAARQRHRGGGGSALQPSARHPRGGSWARAPPKTTNLRCLPGADPESRRLGRSGGTSSRASPVRPEAAFSRRSSPDGRHTPGVPHVRGVHVRTGEEISADLVVDIWGGDRRCHAG